MTAFVIVPGIASLCSSILFYKAIFCFLALGNTFDITLTALSTWHYVPGYSWLLCAFVFIPPVKTEPTERGERLPSQPEADAVSAWIQERLLCFSTSPRWVKTLHHHDCKGTHTLTVLEYSSVIWEAPFYVISYFHVTVVFRVKAGIFLLFCKKDTWCFFCFTFSVFQVRFCYFPTWVFTQFSKCPT